MKILLTGEPRSGKTTILEGFIDSVPNKQGFVTREVRKNGERAGFELISSLGQSATLASVDSDSPIRVSRYGVDVDELDTFIEALPPPRSGNLLYVDEIGQMELFSEGFKNLVISYLDSPNPYAGTISSIYENEFTKQVLDREDIVLLHISESNRQLVKEALNGLSENINLLEQLTPAARNKVTEMAKKYAKKSQYTQLKKLFKNAIKYTAEGKVSQINAASFQVQGNTKKHEVAKVNSTWTCDCDLFNGKGDFAGEPGECSHIQAVELARAKS